MLKSQEKKAKEAYEIYEFDIENFKTIKNAFSNIKKNQVEELKTEMTAFAKKVLLRRFEPSHVGRIIDTTWNALHRDMTLSKRHVPMGRLVF